jgi:uncharacterized protein Usg
MPSRIYVSGPAYVWAGTRVAAFNTPYNKNDYDFFGFTESGVTLSTRGHFEEVYVDYAGGTGAMPADVSMLGMEVTAGGLFTRYNETILHNFMSFLNGVAAGFGPPMSMGTLMMSEDPFQGANRMASPPIMIYSPYGFKQTNGLPDFPDMMKSIRFYSAYIPEPLSQVLNVHRKAPTISWKAIPAFGALSNGLTGTFIPGAPPFDTYQLYSVNDIQVASDIPSL